MVSLLGILIGLAAYIALVYNGYNTIFISIVAAMIVALFGGLNPFTALTEFYSVGFAGFFQSYVIMFTFSCLFAKLMADSGAATSIALKVSQLTDMAKNKKMRMFLCVMTLPLVNVILTLGGVSLFVVTFILVGIARPLFEKNNVPWRLYTCSCLGSATFTCVLFPGSPQIQNLIPMEYFGTTPTSGAVLGILGSLFMIAWGCGYIWIQITKADKNGEGFLPTGSEIVKDEAVKNFDDFEPLPMWRALLPMIVLFVVLNGLKQTANVALVCAIITCYLVLPRENIAIKKVLPVSVPQGIMVVAAVAAASGFGKVISNVEGFQYVVSNLANIPGPKALQIVIAVNVAAGICGSSSSGMRICLDALSEQFLATGIAPGALHRLVGISSVGLDTLPQCAAAQSTFAVTKLTHKQAYNNFLWISVIGTIVTALFVALLITLGIQF